MSRRDPMSSDNELFMRNQVHALHCTAQSTVGAAEYALHFRPIEGCFPVEAKFAVSGTEPKAASYSNWLSTRFFEPFGPGYLSLSGLDSCSLWQLLRPGFQPGEGEDLPFASQTFRTGIRTTRKGHRCYEDGYAIRTLVQRDVDGRVRPAPVT
ncbi:unnamed protein product [Symbiodinium sp. CCMP2456]|nr:unnamed protein product [Symbiodinium sp. CCMP2456]